MECTDRTQRMWLERGEAIGRWLKSAVRRVERAARGRRADGRSRVRTAHGPLLR